MPGNGPLRAHGLESGCYPTLPLSDSFPDYSTGVNMSDTSTLKLTRLSPGLYAVVGEDILVRSEKIKSWSGRGAPTNTGGGVVNYVEWTARFPGIGEIAKAGTLAKLKERLSRYLTDRDAGTLGTRGRYGWAGDQRPAIRRNPSSNDPNLTVAKLKLKRIGPGNYEHVNAATGTTWEIFHRTGEYRGENEWIYMRTDENAWSSSERRAQDAYATKADAVEALVDTLRHRGT